MNMSLSLWPLLYCQILCLFFVYANMLTNLTQAHYLFIEVVSAEQTYEWKINEYLDHALIKQCILETDELDVMNLLIQYNQ